VPAEDQHGLAEDVLEGVAGGAVVELQVQRPLGVDQVFEFVRVEAELAGDGLQARPAGAAAGGGDEESLGGVLSVWRHKSPGARTAGRRRRPERVGRRPI
jgi:hypothetical protein